jgi:hypothetical protein
MMLESSDKKPPSLARLKEMCLAMNLQAEEAKKLINAAMIERMTPDMRRWFNEYSP